MPKDVLPEFSKLDALSPYRPGSALLLSPKGMAPQPAACMQSDQNLKIGLKDLLCLWRALVETGNKPG